MARGKGRRGRGRGGRGGKGSRAPPIPERKSPSPNFTESPSTSNSSTASEKEAEMNHQSPSNLVHFEDMDYVYITVSHSHQLHNENENEEFPILLDSEAAAAVEAVVRMEDEVPPPPPPPSLQENSTSGIGSLEMDNEQEINLQDIQDVYNFAVLHSDLSAGIEAEPETAPKKRIVYVDIQHFARQNSEDVTMSLQKIYSGEGGEVVVKTEVIESLCQSDRPIPPTKPETFNRIELTPLRRSQAELEQIESGPSASTPLAIRNLREHCNRLREEDEAEDWQSDSDHDVKYDPLQDPPVEPKMEPSSPNDD